MAKYPNLFEHYMCFRRIGLPVSQATMWAKFDSICELRGLNPDEVLIAETTEQMDEIFEYIFRKGD